MAVLEVWSLGMRLTELSGGGVDAKAVLLLALVQGGIPIAISLGLMGAATRRPGLSVVGAGLIFLEGAAPIFNFAWLAVMVSGLFLLAARDVAPIRGATLVGARVLGSVAGLWALACVPRLFRDHPLVLVFLVVALSGLVAVGWWPAPATEKDHNLDPSHTSSRT
jgi:hypothetical protein